MAMISQRAVVLETSNPSHLFCNLSNSKSRSSYFQFKMAQKCVHKGCGKTFADPEEDCIYHPGPPVFHEGQKGVWAPSHMSLRLYPLLTYRTIGWKCCKPRYLTFDEFLSIPPCTTGKHSTVDDTPQPDPPPSQVPEDVPPPPKPIATNGHIPEKKVSRAPQAAPPAAPPPVQPESDSDDPAAEITPNITCRRRGCNVASTEESKVSREGEECVYHPGQALFHEGSKGWTCCKRRVLEFDEFMKIEGCKTKERHLFVGSKKDPNKEEEVSNIR